MALTFPPVFAENKRRYENNISTNNNVLRDLCVCASALYCRLVQIRPAKYIDKVVTVKICEAKPSSFEAAKGYVSYHCWTAYNGERGGYVYVLVPAKKAKAFGRDYGKPKAKSKVGGESSIQIPTRDLRAKFSKVKWSGGAEEYVLIVD